MEIKADQRTPEWYDARLGRATASKFNVIMSGTKYAQYKNYVAEVVSERLTGTSPENYVSKEMQHGIDFEATARLKYELTTGNEAIECGFFQHTTMMAGASPDGLVGDDGVLEIKCPNTATHLLTLHTQTIPKQYYWQVVGQMWVTNRKWCDFISFDPRLPANAQLFITRIQRHEPDIEALTSAVDLFLGEVDHEENFVKSYTKGV